MQVGREFFVGLDVGQSRDYSALAVLDRPASSHRPAYALRHLQRFRLGTPYPQVVQAVVRLLETPALSGAFLAVDRTGVGRAVVDLLAERLQGRADCRLVAVTITGGNAAKAGDGGASVPKRALVGALQALLGTGRFRIASGLAEAPTLLRELEAFRVKLSDSGHESFEAGRAGAHDDLVLACALAAWVGENAPTGVTP